MDQIAKERAFKNDALQKDSSTTLAESVFRSRATRRRLLHGEMALRARESCDALASCDDGKTGRSKAKYSPCSIDPRAKLGGHRPPLQPRKTHAAITAHRTSATRPKALVARPDSHARNRKMRGQIWPDGPHKEPSSRRHQVAATRRSPC